MHTPSTLQTPCRGAAPLRTCRLDVGASDSLADGAELETGGTESAVGAGGFEAAFGGIPVLLKLHDLIS